MIEQHYPIESLPKYNFSDAFTDNIASPNGFANLCLLSLKKLHSQPPNLPQPDDTDVTLHPHSTSFSTTMIPLRPSKEPTSIAGVDVSSIRIGETKEGVLIAVRGAVVWNVHQLYHYLRLGPFIFHITESNKKQILDLLSKYQNNLPIEIGASDSFHLQTRIGNTLERWIQSNLCSTCSNALILLDGSLTAGTPDTPESVITRILQMARTRANRILAFSKFSHIRLNGKTFADIATERIAPYLIKIDDPSECMGNFKLLGNVYVARFSNDDICFRLDTDKSLQQPEILDAVERLLGNDVFPHGLGYPETLRLAHIYSTFTANEVIGMQRYLEQEQELKLAVKPNIRRLLFGPFGKGQEV